MSQGNYRKNVIVGSLVDIVLKKNQSTGKLTSGVVKRLLTNSDFHPHGIKVLLESGEVGRVQYITEEEDLSKYFD